MGGEPRRADFVAWYSQEDPLLSHCVLRAPERVSYDDLLRVHTPSYLDSLLQPETLGHIFATDPSEIPVDELLRSVRLGCGATVEAADLEKLTPWLDWAFETTVAELS